MWPFHKTPDQQVEPFDITQAAIVDRLTDIPSHWVEGPEYINPRGFGERSLLIGSWIEKPNYVAPTDNSLSVLQNVGNISARTVFQVTCSYEPGSKSTPGHFNLMSDMRQHFDQALAKSQCTEVADSLVRGASNRDQSSPGL